MGLQNRVDPNPLVTPGVTNPDVTPATLSTTICQSGWTRTIRPPSGYTTLLKIQQIAQYGYTDTATTSYEEDHLIPLEVGGSPKDPANLWPEPAVASAPDGTPAGFHVKDRFENYLKAQVCAGTMALAVAQRQIASDWYGSWLADGRP